MEKQIDLYEIIEDKVVPLERVVLPPSLYDALDNDNHGHIFVYWGRMLLAHGEPYEVVNVLSYEFMKSQSVIKIEEANENLFLFI